MQYLLNSLKKFELVGKLSSMFYKTTYSQAHVEPSFLNNPGSTCLGMVPSTVDVALLQQSAVMEMAPQTCPWAKMIEAVLEMRSPLPRYVTAY